uniref:L-xylulose reductase n=1 Tax=Timema genevievae TaxID=629358 RepID=A0A7R9JYF5_TIMGE|nr:unnamed protein product [Timema genevievae]
MKPVKGKSYITCTDGHAGRGVSLVYSGLPVTGRRDWTPDDDIESWSSALRMVSPLSFMQMWAGLANHLVYCGTKGAVDAMTRAMALELGPHNIRVNTVNPTVVMTAMGKLGWSIPEKAASMVSKIPLGRLAEVHEVVDATIFLLSDKSSMISGIALPVDGGFLAC